MWKEPVVRVGTTPDVVRLNSRVEGPAVVIFVHDGSGEAHAARPLAAKLPCPAFGVRATPVRGGGGDPRGGRGDDDDDAADRDGGVMMPDDDIPALAARYLSTAHRALGLTVRRLTFTPASSPSCSPCIYNPPRPSRPAQCPRRRCKRIDPFTPPLPPAPTLAFKSMKARH